jgi:hypothetical protein
MNKETFGIGILSLTAVVLIVANYFAAPVATASEAVKERDYQVVTARIQQGGEGLYVLDNRTGILAVLSYDPTTRKMVARATRPLADAFAANTGEPAPAIGTGAGTGTPVGIPKRR